VDWAEESPKQNTLAGFCELGNETGIAIKAMPAEQLPQKHPAT
jgi:hypothetical protein